MQKSALLDGKPALLKRSCRSPAAGSVRLNQETINIAINVVINTVIVLAISIAMCFRYVARPG